MIAAGLGLIMITQCFFQPVLAKEEATYEKNENVYVHMTADGEITGTYVVNSYTVEEATDITDYGDYTKIQNLTNMEALNQNGDEISFHAEEGKFYYQGDMENVELPWDISITYKLDGNKIMPEELAGKTGALEITIDTKKNNAVDSRYYENYLLQISLSLDAETTRNIVAEDAAVAEAGTAKQVVFTGMPEQDNHFVLKADVENFEMDGISVTGTPFSMAIDMGDTDEMVDQFDELTDAVDQLNEGTAQLAEGMKKLSDGAGSLKSGSAQFASGLTTLSGNSKSIVKASKQIKSALNTINKSLGQADFSDLNQLSELKKACETMVTSLDTLSSGLSQLNQGYSAAFTALDAAISAIPEANISEAELGALYTLAQNDETAKSAYDKLTAQYKAAQTVKGTYSKVKDAFSAVNQQLPTVKQGIDSLKSGINQMKSGLDGVDTNAITTSLSSLKTGISQLNSSYSKFHSGLKSYTDGVDTLSSSYKKLDEGLKEYTKGVSEAADGTEELADGTNEFAINVEDLPEKVQEQIDDLTAKYDTSDFEPLSFTSEQNKNVNAVQFIISTDGIQIEEEEETAPVEEKEGFLDRVKNLFR